MPPTIDPSAVQRAADETRARIRESRRVLTEQIDAADALVLAASSAALRGAVGDARRSLDGAAELLYAALETAAHLDPFYRALEGGAL